VDCICLDLEDGVAWERKGVARQSIVEALSGLNFGSAERLVRINAAASEIQMEDLIAVLPLRPQGIVIPKAENPREIQDVSHAAAAAEERYGWEPGEIALIAIIESARAVLNLAALAAADPRLQVLALGAEDMAADIGASRSREGWEMFYARSTLVLYAAAHGLQTIDMVYIDLNDLQGLEREARVAAGMGFSGKQVIHPAQIEPVQRAFTPSANQVEYARRLVNAWEENRREGRNVFALDGKMVEVPMVQAARRLLAQASEGES
jgi:citrate lyase beta subunit